MANKAQLRPACKETQLEVTMTDDLQEMHPTVKKHEPWIIGPTCNHSMKFQDWIRLYPDAYPPQAPIIGIAGQTPQKFPKEWSLRRELAPHRCVLRRMCPTHTPSPWFEGQASSLAPAKSPNNQLLICGSHSHLRLSSQSLLIHNLMVAKPS